MDLEERTVLYQKLEQLDRENERLRIEGRQLEQKSADLKRIIKNISDYPEIYFPKTHIRDNY